MLSMSNYPRPPHFLPQQMIQTDPFANHNNYNFNLPNTFFQFVEDMRGREGPEMVNFPNELSYMDQSRNQHQMPSGNLPNNFYMEKPLPLPHMWMEHQHELPFVNYNFPQEVNLKQEFDNRSYTQQPQHNHHQEHQPTPQQHHNISPVVPQHINRGKKYQVFHYNILRSFRRTI